MLHTTTQIAALNTLSGEVISLCQERHRHNEWLRFLRLLDDVTPAGKELHLIADNCATHKHLKVHRWLARHPRFEAPKPFIWTASANDILEKVKRARAALLKGQSA